MKRQALKPVPDYAGPIMPKFYYYRGKAGSDRDWIMKRMAVIPKERQAAVAQEYEKRYLNKNAGFGRQLANQYLQGVAVEYRDQRRGAE